MPKQDSLTSRIRDQAWIGDAVLELFARRYILREKATLDGAMADRLTCNQFLSGFGNPTEVEAQIGRLYESEGYAAAEEWISENLLHKFLKQEKNRDLARKNGLSSKKR